MSLSFKNTKNKKQKKIQDQKESNEILASWDFKPRIGNLNFSQISGG